jgi:hypothetical protein
MYEHSMETVTIAIRVHKSLREAFFKACESDDNTASRVIRAAMRDYIAQHAQLELRPIGRPRKQLERTMLEGRTGGAHQRLGRES